MSTPVNPNAPIPVTQAELNAHSEQALIELIYVQTANDLLGTAMSNLSSALNTTQSVLNILQALQGLHNDISVQSKSAFNFNYRVGPSSVSSENVSAGITAGPVIPPGAYDGGIVLGVVVTRFSVKFITGQGFQRVTTHFSAHVTDYQHAYMSAASAYFGKAIDPFFVFANSAASGYSQFRSSLMILRNHLRTEISTLTKQTPSASLNDPANLLNTVKKVFNELPSTFTFSAVEKWALDNYNLHGASGVSQAGLIENDLTSAITAAESLNDSQKEKVRNYLFIFQEYYQSASAVLSAISQIINQIAQKISQ